jgi:antirestriction protein ArdC
MPDTVTKTLEKTDNKERIKEITDKLEQGIKDLFEGDKFKEYLNTMSKFHSYSFNNTLLIHQQKPNASLVAGFNTWKNKFERNVMGGENGIKIFAPAPFKTKKEMEVIDDNTGFPMIGRDGKPLVEEVEITIPYFKIVNVFDVSQTAGKELPSLGVEELSGDVAEYEKFFEALKEISPAPIEFKAIAGGSKGYYDHAEKRIAVNEGMSELQNIKTAIHEIAHAKLHDRDLVKADLVEVKDKKTMEVEAEAVAYTVCQHYGIDTSDYSFGYVAAWGSGKEMTELKSSLETVRSTANEIINKIDEQMLDHYKDKLSQLDHNSPAGGEKAEQKSNIIGNTEYKDIADKAFFNVASATAVKIAAELETKGVKFSGKVNDNNKTTFTLEKADTDVFREVEKAIKAQEKADKPKPDKSNIIGNAEYKNIPNKKYLKVDNHTAEKVKAGLEVEGIKFSGRVNGDTTTFTVSAADIDKVREIEKAANAHKIPPKAQETEISQAANGEKPNIIGNFKFSEIENKKYFKIDTTLAVKVAEELEKRGIKFSGRVGGEKTTLTLNNADSDTFKAVAKEVRAAMSVPETEQVVADKFPKPSRMEGSYSIYQLNDNPGNRDIRFESLQHLDENNITVNPDNYNLAYSSLFIAETSQKLQLLEGIFEQFNIEHPADFKGNSPSVSDVIVIKIGEEVTAHYCDKVGFTEIPDFIKGIHELNQNRTEDTIDPYSIGEKGLDGYSVEQLGEFLKVVDTKMKNVEMQAQKYYAERGMDNNLPDAPGIFNIKIDKLQDIKMNIWSKMEALEAEQINVKPTLSEFQTAVDKGESISVMDLIEAGKNEKPEKAEKRPKKSIKARLEADKKANSAPAQTEQVQKKNKGEVDL